MKRQPTARKIIHSLNEMPDFASEDEEREWWAQHELSDELYNSLEDVSAELDKIAPLPRKAKAAPKR
ncbi:MAG TPA: hypothetical protein VII57_07410 [Dehalococcoidia bacterium]